MKIGIDLRVLQTGHQFRGVGEVAKRTLNEIFALAKESPDAPRFVFYQYSGAADPKLLLEVPQGLAFETIDLGPIVLPESNRSISEKIASRWRALYGNPVPHGNACDVFLQFDFGLGIPTNVNRSVLVKHDIIPYIFWNDYFTSPWVHFKNKAARTTLRTILHNYESKRVLYRSLGHAKQIVCVSQHTFDDLWHHVGVPKKKMQVIHLGVSTAALKGQPANSAKLPTKPYLLFVGAVDARRRRIDDVVAAYNNLKADGHDIQLVLAGENFPSAQEIPNLVVREAVMKSSYADDILTVGYIDDATKYALYKGAMAFVFPTTYEGFGIPVLEAMLLECPVITYKNSSVAEIGQKFAIYAKDWQTILSRVEQVADWTPEQKSDWIAAAKQHAESYTWQKTGHKLYDVLLGK